MTNDQTPETDGLGQLAISRRKQTGTYTPSTTPDDGQYHGSQTPHFQEDLIAAEEKKQRQVAMQQLGKQKEEQNKPTP